MSLFSALAIFSNISRLFTQILHYPIFYFPKHSLNGILSDKVLVLPSQLSGSQHPPPNTPPTNSKTQNQKKEIMDGNINMSNIYQKDSSLIICKTISSSILILDTFCKDSNLLHHLFSIYPTIHTVPSRNKEGKSPSGEMTTGPSGKVLPS